MYDIVIIGAGITGCSIARELSRYDLKVLVLEKENDVAMGTTKANSAIVHAGYDARPGSLMAEMNVRGSLLYENLCRELEVPYKRIGSLVIAFGKEEKKVLDKLLDRGIQNKVPDLSIITGDQVREREPHINPGVTHALYAPTAAIVSPYELAIALMENAIENGVEFKRQTQVKSISKQQETFSLTTAEFGRDEQQTIRAKCVVNCAGVYADQIHEMAGGSGFTITPRRGEYHLLDKSQGHLVSHVVFQVPTDKGKGILVTPTVHGNLIVGPNAQDLEDKTDTSTTYEGLSGIVEKAKTTIKDFILRESITSYAGLRAYPKLSGGRARDFIISESEQVKHFINVAGICSPGLASAPAIAERVVHIIASSGVLSFIPSITFTPMRKHIPVIADATAKRAEELYKMDKRYGSIVCRCEQVSEAEIVQAISRHAGAGDLDGIKRRVRAGMGRCHGGFCISKVLTILSRELDIPPEEITLLGKKSYVLTGKTKQERK